MTNLHDAVYKNPMSLIFSKLFPKKSFRDRYSFSLDDFLPVLRVYWLLKRNDYRLLVESRSQETLV